MFDHVDIANIIVALMGSGVWVFLLERIRERVNKKTADKKMLIGLAHDRIYSLCEKYLERGTVSIDELENLDYLYQPYKELGGNGTGEKLYEAVSRLPKKTEN